MKKGKTSQIKGFKTAKVFYGTVNSVNFKSLYLNIQTWVEPQRESENWNRVVLNMSRNVKHSILDSIDKKLFDDKFIVDLDLRSSGLNLGKKSFMNLEANFYLSEDNIDFKSTYLRESLKKITSQIFINNFQENEFFKFYLTKKSKTSEELTQIDNV